MKVTVVQPKYFCGENPDEKIAKFLLCELAALPRAAMMLEKASEIAKNKKAYVAINVLERRNGEIKNSTYLFDTKGSVAFIYDKQHLPPSEVNLGVKAGNDSGKCKCVCELDGIKFAFMTCYDVYFNEQIEYIAKDRPDIVLIPGYQRGERVDIIHAQAKLTAFRCNAFVARSSFSMDSDEKGGCSMIVAPDGIILKDMGKDTGSISCEINPLEKYMREAGFGGDTVRNDEFISAGLCPEAFR